MSLSFDTTHEYYLKDAMVHYCGSHNSLILASYSGETTDRIVLGGLDKDTMNKFRLELNKEFVESCADVSN